MLTFLLDKKNQAALAGALATILIQLAHAKGWGLDADTANHLTFAIVGLAGTLVLGHAHETASENHADGVVSAAQVTAKGAVAAAQQTEPAAQTVTVNEAKSP